MYACMDRTYTEGGRTVQSRVDLRLPNDKMRERFSLFHDHAMAKGMHAELVRACMRCACVCTCAVGCVRACVCVCV